MSEKLAAYHEAAALPELPDEPLKGNGKLPAWHWHLTPLAGLSSYDLGILTAAWARGQFEQLLLSELENRRGVPPK